MEEVDMSMLVRQADGDDPLSALAALAQLRRETDRREAVVVRRARVAGVPWASIATMLGVSKQAVHKKYGGSRFSRTD
ncbi:hypothetical protein Q760_07395 [Cellulomonas cellasea DSM 20118]|uniref:Uncharacterized protein n=3 Tax=Cellulomonas cellasea TaxID=43670 RepID=A0A0A0B5P0_9CELL|nr:hypothetical protein Q760_07395 [Cellulomonas cellasea DSM 20118]GEA87022.1 hypothetical protein CCE01nite_09710 [Cellulomonas cellasea]